MKIGLWVFTLVFIIVVSYFAWHLPDDAPEATGEPYDPCPMDTIVDRVDKSVAIKNSEPIIMDSNSHDKFMVVIRKEDPDLGIIIGAPDIFCVEDDNPVYLIFNDGSHLKFKNNLGFNCKSTVIIYLPHYAKNDNVISIKPKRIQAIRIESYGRIYEVDFTVRSSDRFHEIFNCLTK